MNYNAKFKKEEVDALFDAILRLENMEECYRFFEDICTIKEVQAFAQRYQIASLLDQNKTYSEIEEATCSSTATISRINKCLLYGAGGYRLILDRIKKEKDAE